MALMAVFQTREYFKDRFGYILDNPEVGPLLAEKYWREGNRKTFFTFLQDLTGKSFSAEAISRFIDRTAEEVALQVEKEVAAEKKIPCATGKIHLDAKIDIVHGDELIASSEDFASYEELGMKFSSWISSLK